MNIKSLSATATPDTSSGVSNAISQAVETALAAQNLVPTTETITLTGTISQAQKAALKQCAVAAGHAGDDGTGDLGAYLSAAFAAAVTNGFAQYGVADPS